MRQTIPLLQFFLLKTFKEIAKAGCRRCFAALRSLSHFFLLLPAFGQLPCPACNFVHFVLRSASLHPFVANPFASTHGMPLQSPYATHTGNAHTFSQSQRCILTGFHSAPLRPTFTSVPLQSTRCLLLLCSPCGHWLRSGARWHRP
ncbi:MAG: hypothetical protein JWQ09_4444 [Segetibacter sp.]|nr:hypothetical protein [Segetibacter sp.]